MKNTAQRILRIDETIEASGYSRPSLWRLEKQGRFPRRIKLGRGRGGAVGWRADEIAAWQDARARGEEWKPKSEA